MEVKKVKESSYRDRLAASIPGAKTEARCQFGLIDVLTPNEVIEIKRLQDWRNAIGQVLSYGSCYPERAKRLHILLPDSNYNKYLEEDVKPFCQSIGVAVTTEPEVERLILIYELGGFRFRSRVEVEIHVKHIRSKNRIPNELKFIDLPPDEEAFMVAFVNLGHWVQKRYGGAVARVRVGKSRHPYCRNKTLGFFEASSDGDKWMALNMNNYFKLLTDLAPVDQILIPQRETFRQ